MANEVARQTGRTAVDEFKNSVTLRLDDFKAALPPHLTVERFQRILVTAVTSNAELLKADRASLLQAAMKAAQDGLLPDGREGAFVIFKSRVQWMPMIGGLLKAIRNSGELLSISAQIVYERDEFTVVLGDDEKIVHEPFFDGERGKPRLAYAIAKTKDGGIYREIMTLAEIEKVRNVSRAKGSGPWVDWWDEMARKTVLRRLSKRLPMSAMVEQIIRRDDEFYDLRGNLPERRPLADRLGGPPATALPGFSAEFVAEHSGSADVTIDATPNIADLNPPPSLVALCEQLSQASTSNDLEKVVADWKEATADDDDLEVLSAGENIINIHESRIESDGSDGAWTEENVRKAVSSILKRLPAHA